MKLEEGMYVRSKINGMIAKITDIETLCVRNPAIEEPYTMDIRYILDNNLNRGFCESEKDSVIASHNIIDLIEIGDVVELFMEDDIDKEDTNIFEIIAITTDKKEIGVLGKDLELEFIPIENIRKICTKEQFESMSYKVEG